MESIEHSGPLWRWSSGKGGSWHFLTIDGEPGETLSVKRLLSRLETGTVRGFGAIRVDARIGNSRWPTFVIPQKDGGWLLPVKAAIRRAEVIGEGDIVTCVLEF